MFIFIGIDTVEGVVGTGIGIAFGVPFCSSTTVAVFEGVENGKLLSVTVFCNFSVCIFSSSLAFATFAFDDTVEEMRENGIAFGVLFSSSTTVAVFEGVANAKFLTVNVFSNSSVCCIFSSSVVFAAFVFDDTVEVMGEKGCRVKGDSISRTIPLPYECFFKGESAISSPLLAA